MQSEIWALIFSLQGTEETQKEHSGVYFPLLAHFCLDQNKKIGLYPNIIESQ